MNAFHFTLEAVRTLRQREENVALENYGRALLARQQAMDRLDKLQREVAAAWHDMRKRLEHGCSAAEAAQGHQFLSSLERRRVEGNKSLAAAERGVNTALHTMLTARQQREVVDSCFDRQKARYEREWQRNEQKILDDLSARRSVSILSWNQTGAVP